MCTHGATDLAKHAWQQRQRADRIEDAAVVRQQRIGMIRRRRRGCRRRDWRGPERGHADLCQPQLLQEPHRLARKGAVPSGCRPEADERWTEEARGSCLQRDGRAISEDAAGARRPDQLIGRSGPSARMHPARRRRDGLRVHPMGDALRRGLPLARPHRPERPSEVSDTRGFGTVPAPQAHAADAYSIRGQDAAQSRTAEYREPCSRWGRRPAAAS